MFDTTSASTVHSGSGKAMFVMDKRGAIYASPEQIVGKYHHSSFLAGKPVSSAGELVVKNGKIIEISRKSGHYRPSVKINAQIMKALKKRGVDIKSIKEKRVRWSNKSGQETLCE